MGVKIHSYGRGTTSGGEDWGECWAFHCPGCGYDHPFHVGGDAKAHPQWTFNGSMEKPTFAPSLVVAKDDPKRRCHIFMREGMIQFLADCWHALKGQTVECPDWDADDDLIRAEALKRNIAARLV